MILYLTTRSSSNTLRFLYRDWVWGLRWRMKRVFYEDVLERGEIPRATLIFTDHERMSPELHEAVCGLWDAAQPHCRTVNNPHRLLARRALLDRLHEDGINPHRGFPAHQVPDDVRYPVFLRGEHDHLGPLTDLLKNPVELACALEAHAKREDLLVVEFQDTRDPDGLYRKYSAFLVGGAIIPKHIVFGDGWITKVHTKGLAHPQVEERALIEQCPHEATLRKVFDLAGIEYGRIDYGVYDGRVVVWEINTNPTVMSDWLRMARWRRPLQRAFVRRYVAGLRSIDTTSRGPSLRLS